MYAFFLWPCLPIVRGQGSTYPIKNLLKTQIFSLWPLLVVKYGHKWHIWFRKIFSKLSLNTRNSKALWKESKHCFCCKQQAVYCSEIVYQLVFFCKADHWLLGCLHGAQNLGVLHGESPDSSENSGSGNEEGQTRHPSLLGFLLVRLQSGCYLCSWGEYIGEVKKTQTNQQSKQPHTFL